MKYKLLKSKDDYSFEHYRTSPLAKLTGFVGTSGEALLDENGHIFLFVDPRYHIQANLQTKGKDVEVIKMSSQYGFIDYLKDFLPDNSELLIPEKSTSYLFYQKLKDNKIYAIPYNTETDYSSVDYPEKPIFVVDDKISGKSVSDKVKNLNNFLITNLEEIAYLLNLRSYKTKNSSTFASKLFIENPNRIFLFCDYNLPELPSFIHIKSISEYENFIKQINSKIYADSSSISLYDYNLLKNPIFLKVNPIKKMASKKNLCELNHYKDCFKRLDDTLYAFRDKIEAGMSEFDLNQIFEKELIKNGALQTSFQTILAVGDNSSIIHYTAISKNKILTENDILLLDCGGYYEGGYATDITRVFVPKNCMPSNKIKEIYTAVLKAQLNVFHSELLMTDELHFLAEKFLHKYETEGFFFPHGLGHGIGIPVHQSPPTLSKKIRTKILNGNVYTIEPGLYKEGEFGIRLENTVYHKNGETKALSHFPYEENLINFDMLSKKEQNWLNNWQEISK